MQYLCTKQLTAGGEDYHPGEVIPDGVILPERSGKLMKSGYLSALKTEVPWEYAAELRETEAEAYKGTVLIFVKPASDGENGQATAVPAKPEEIQQVFSILQMNAEEGAKAVADVRNENILILLHAADNRKTIKNAAKEQADRLFLTERDLSAAIGSETKGADT